MARAIPILFLAGGELVLALVALRVGVWVARGWREWRAVATSGDEGPPGPGGGLRLVTGGRSEARGTAAATSMRPAA